MKKRITTKRRFNSIISLSISALVLIGCADLDNDVSDIIPAAEPFEDAAEYEKGLGSVYQALSDAARKTTFFAPAWAGDDITTFSGGNKADFRQFDQRSVSADNSRLVRNWNGLYNMISNIHVTLSFGEELEAKAVKSNDEELLEAIKLIRGELFFLRAFSYHQLVRVFGEIPITLDVIPDPNISKSSVQAVYEQIEKDLKLAIDLLPTQHPLSVSSGNPAVRPSQGSAKSYLARVYLDWAGFPVKGAPLSQQERYALAASQAKEVIDRKNEFNFNMLPDIFDLWKKENRFVTESLWSIGYSVGPGETNVLENQKFGAVGFNGGWDETFAEVKYFEDFPAGPRKEATYRTDLDWVNLAQPSPMFAKITGPAGDYGRNTFKTDRSDFIMRYPEILLIYAEASGRSGNGSVADAWEALNKVRRRAQALPIDTPDTSVDLDTSDGTIEDLAFLERKWEFAGEYIRWFDLVRLEKVEEALSDRVPRVSRNSDNELVEETNKITGSLGIDNYFSPIPASVVSENPNLSN